MSENTPTNSTASNADHLVILIHGFNTRALWMNDIKPTLQQQGFIVRSTSFGYYGFIRFLSFPACRNAAKARLLKDIRTAARLYRDDNDGRNPAKISVISHSFGSFLFMQIMRDNPELKFYLVIICGSIFLNLMILIVFYINSPGHCLIKSAPTITGLQSENEQDGDMGLLARMV